MREVEHEEGDDEKSGKPRNLFIDDAGADQQSFQSEGKRNTQGQQDEYGSNQVIHDGPAVFIYRHRAQHRCRRQGLGIKRLVGMGQRFLIQILRTPMQLFQRGIENVARSQQSQTRLI